MTDFLPWQWIFGAVAGFLVGITKTGIPGLGIMVVPLLAAVFGGRASVGIMLSMLLFGDVFAVAWYRRHTQWSKLVGLLPWVTVGMGMGAAALWASGKYSNTKDILSLLIGALVLIMLALHLLEQRSSHRLIPQSAVGVASVGVSAGFATTVSNAAGPVMLIYLLAHKLNKQEFMGTIAWYFFIINLGKMPVFFALSAINPLKPIITMQSLIFVFIISPAIVVGLFVGKWLLYRFPQKAFEGAILVLSAMGAIYLIVQHL